MASDDSRDQLRAFLDPVWKTSFFQTVKLIELMMRREREARGDRDPTQTPGGFDDPEAEPLEFKTNVGLRFAPTDLTSVDLDSEMPSLTVEFMTLAGVRGPLPLHYAQLVRERNRRGDTGLQDFLDIFAHRLISLLWRIRQKFRPGLHAGEMADHDLTRYLMAFSGLLGEKTTAIFDDYAGDYDPEGDDQHIYAQDLAYYSGLFWQHDRSMEGLERILSHAFGFPVHGRSCQGEWIELEDDARTALTTRLGHNLLGVSAIAGRRVWDAQAGFAIDIGPVDWQTFLDLLPIGRRYNAVHRLVNFYSRGAFNFSFNIAVVAEEIHDARPGLSTEPFGPRLGWTSWLTTAPLTGAASSVRVSGGTHAMDDQVAPAPLSEAPLADGP
ncbi:MAG: type VI secretion system protein ImpH [Bradymonadia bacterium]|jgi:type VI secretion system protein ImpH